jgi:hypothetical protein
MALEHRQDVRRVITRINHDGLPRALTAQNAAVHL